MDGALAERVLVPLAGPDDADRTARAIRPHLDAETTLIVTHIVQGQADTAETTVKTGRDQFAQTTYETFVSLLNRSDLDLEWVTLEGREIAEALVDAVEIVDATMIAFTPRDLDAQSRLLTGDPGRRLLRDPAVPVLAVPDRSE